MALSFIDMLMGTESEAKVTQASTKTETQRSSLDELLKMLSSEVTADPDDIQLTEQEIQQQALLSQLMGDAGAASTATLEASQFDAQGIDDLFNTTIRDPLMRDARDNLIPEIAARYGSQFFSSERIGQEGNVMSNLMNTLAGEKNKLIQGERERQLQALGLMPSTIGAASGVAQVKDPKTAKRTELMQLILGGTGQTTFENIATVTPGQEGGAVAFLGGLGQGLGSACWVAEVLYGYNSDITYTIRAYVKDHMNDDSMLGIFFRKYSQDGKVWANSLLLGLLPWDGMKTIWDSLYRLALLDQE